jgi:hypothetical protein
MDWWRSHDTAGAVMMRNWQLRRGRQYWQAWVNDYENLAVVYFGIAGLSGHVWELPVPASMAVEDVIAQQLTRRQAHGFRPAPPGRPATVRIQYPPECFPTVEDAWRASDEVEHALHQRLVRDGRGLPPLVDYSSELTFILDVADLSQDLDRVRQAVEAAGWSRGAVIAVQHGPNEDPIWQADRASGVIG